MDRRNIKRCATNTKDGDRRKLGSQEARVRI